MIKFSKQWTLEEKTAFIHGYAKAETMKQEGLFKDLSINEVTIIIIEEAIKTMGGKVNDKNS